MADSNIFLGKIQNVCERKKLYEHEIKKGGFLF